jgi:hypothetical protein
VLLDREVGEDLPSSGTRPRPRRAIRCGAPASTRSPRKTTLAALRRMQAADRAHQGRLAHAVAAEEGDHLAGAHLEVDAVQHLAAAVAGVQAAHREQGAVIPRPGRPRSRRRRGAPPRARRWR